MLVLVALTLVFLLGIAALAVDLGAMRYDHRANTVAADAAATAGAAAINPFSGSQADEACEVAWAYLLLNLDDEGPSNTPPNCAVFATACSPGTVRQATASAGPYSFVITHPIPDAHELMSGQAINSDFDGASCQRFGVTVEREREYVFAPVLGFDSGTPEVNAVARTAANVGEGEVVPLVVLEPYACDALTADGQGKITVKHFADSPGFIVVDSNGSNCSSSSPFTMEVQAVGNQRWIRALPVPAPDNIPSAILSYALSGTSGAAAANSFDPDDLTTAVVGTDPADPAESRFQLYPEPQAISQRVTRAPIDHRYNCKGAYPNYLGIPIAPCAETPGTFIDQLTTDYGGLGSPTGIFQRWSDTHSCSVGVGEVIEVTGDWWVDCDPFVINGATVRFTDGDVVVDGEVDLKGNTGLLQVNTDMTDAQVLYIRDGDLSKGSFATIQLNRTFAYLGNGRLSLVGGAGGLIWTAPIAGDFDDLALWSESADPHELGGQAGNTLTGTFFTPFADPFILKGQAGQLQTSAQFLTRRLEVTGFTEVIMQPDPDTSTLIPIRAVMLIR